MSFFGGMAAGYGAAQGDYNTKMLDFENKKSQDMATMYGHLADNADDQDVAAEFANRAAGWASADPRRDPKGYKALMKNEKGGIHAIVDQAHQNKINDYHQTTFGAPASPQALNPDGGGGGGKPQAPATPGQTQPAPQNTSQDQGPPQVQPMGGGTNPPAMGSLGGGSAPTAPPPSVAANPATQATQGAPAMPAAPTQATPQTPQVPGIMPQAPPTQAPPVAAPPEAQGPQGMPTANIPLPTPTTPSGVPGASGTSTSAGTTPSGMDQYVRSMLPPEPAQYGAMGRHTGEWKTWHDAYQKRLEATVPTPPFMQQAMGPYMSSGFASPYIGLMRGEMMAGARAIGSGFKMDSTTHQWVPLKPEEQSLLQQARVAKDSVQSLLAESTIPLRQAMTSLATGKTKLLPVEMAVRLRQIGIAQQNADNVSIRTNAAVFGRDARTGKPLPGALAIDDGTGNMTPVGTMFDRSVLPTSATQRAGEAAVGVVSKGNELIQMATDPSNADLFGKASGNIAQWVALHPGTSDTREGRLSMDLISLASLMVPLHGFRSQRAQLEFLQRMSQGNSPQAFAAAVRGALVVADNMHTVGVPNVFDASGGTHSRTPIKPIIGGGGDYTHPNGDPNAVKNTGKFTPASTAQKRQALMDAGWDGKPGSMTPGLRDKATKSLQAKGLQP